MSKKVQVQINPSRPEGAGERSFQGGAPVSDAVPPVTEQETVAPAEPSAPRPAAETEAERLEAWRDRALRLQAEMENYRRRQRRLAEERILADREQLLRALLPVTDDLARALDAPPGDAESLREGVALTYQSLMRLLDQEGVETLHPEGKPFDPTWHEAIGAVPHPSAEAGTVVEVMQRGYRLGERLLRPARVLIAS